MNTCAFLTVIFLPLVFSLYLTAKRLTLSVVNKKVLNFALVLIAFLCFGVSVSGLFISFDFKNLFFSISNAIFLFISFYSALYFGRKKQFMFTRLRYNIYLALIMFLTNLFIYLDNLVMSFLIWALSGVLIYVFSYFDIFKTSAEYNPNRFYSMFLAGDFALLLAIFIMIKNIIIFDSSSYLIDFSQIRTVIEYVSLNNHGEYMILIACIVIALFSRGLIFPFSCLMSFLANSSSLFYINVFCIFAPLYSLVLFLKLNLFENINSYMEFYLIFAIALTLINLLFEKHFKIIFGYIFSIINTSFVILYFYNKKISFIFYIVAFFLVILVMSLLFLFDKLSSKKRLINIHKGFVQERFSIFIFEKLPFIFSSLAEFIERKICMPVFYLFRWIAEFFCFQYMIFIGNKKISKIIKGILFIYTLFMFLAVFIALFGSYGEIQS